MADTPASSERPSLLSDPRIAVRLDLQAALPEVEEPGLGAGASLSLPWTQWTPLRTDSVDLGVGLSPQAVLLWRPGQEFMMGGGVEAHVTQSGLRMGPFSFLDDLMLSAGYGGDDMGGLPYFSGMLRLVRYDFDETETPSVAVVGGVLHARDTMPTAGASATFSIAALQPPPPREIDPSSIFRPVGRFVPGRVTYLYYAIELRDENNQPLHDRIPLADRIRLIEEDRRFAFEVKDSPLHGLGNQVNILITRKPVVVRLKAPLQDLVRQHGGKASGVVDLWGYHEAVQDLVAAHPDFFGENVQAVAQIPYEVRDQFLWFRFDKIEELARKGWEGLAREALSLLLQTGGDPDGVIDRLFPRLTVPLGLHAAGTGDFRLDLSPVPEAGVPQSSVVLFHELFGHGGTEAVARECRASDEYSEDSLESFLKTHPHEASWLRFAGETVEIEELVRQAPAPLRDVLRSVLSRLAGGRGELNLLSVLTQSPVSRRIVGKPLGQPNVLPNDARTIEEVWGRIPGFSEHLWDEKSGRAPREGDVQIVPGGLYFPDRPFVRLQVFRDGQWRDTYMLDSHNPEAPLGPVMEHCLSRTRDLILRHAVSQPSGPETVQGGP